MMPPDAARDGAPEPRPGQHSDVHQSAANDDILHATPGLREVERISIVEPPEEFLLRELFTAEQMKKLLPRTVWLYLIRESILPPSQRLLAMVLWTHAGKQASCWPSQDTLARESGLSVRTVRRGLETLEAGCWIERVRWSRRDSATYHLCWPTFDQIRWPETGHSDPTQTGHGDLCTTAETGHPVPSADTSAVRPATDDSETGHGDRRRSSEGVEDGAAETASEFDLAALLDSAMPGRRRRVA